MTRFSEVRAIREHGWAAYNADQVGRSPRRLAQDLVEIAGPGQRRLAVELGCGAGIESRYLAESGWRVVAFDSDPSFEGADGQGEGQTADPQVDFHGADLAALERLPTCDAVLSCVALPFLNPGAFARLWDLAVSSLNSGGFLAVDLFGVHDDWVGGEGTFLTRDAVKALTVGFDILHFRESQHDGRSFSGPKHWHTYELIASKKAGR